MQTRSRAARLTDVLEAEAVEELWLGSLALLALRGGEIIFHEAGEAEPATGRLRRQRRSTCKRDQTIKTCHFRGLNREAQPVIETEAPNYTGGCASRRPTNMHGNRVNNEPREKTYYQRRRRVDVQLRQ